MTQSTEPSCCVPVTDLGRTDRLGVGYCQSQNMALNCVQCPGADYVESSLDLHQSQITEDTSKPSVSV